MVLKSDPQSDRISELGAVLTAMASGCPENAEQFLYSLFTSSALAVFSKKANRTLVHRFRKPVRDVLQQVSQNGRKRLLRLVPGLGRHVGRLLVDALIYLDFDGLIGEFDALLSDRNTNGGVKELIRRHKYLRQRTSGGRQWPELYDEMSRMLAAAV